MQTFALGNGSGYLIQDGNGQGVIVVVPDGSKWIMPNLPTTDPKVKGQIWQDAQALKVSKG